MIDQDNEPILPSAQDDTSPSSMGIGTLDYTSQSPQTPLMPLSNVTSRIGGALSNFADEALNTPGAHLAQWASGVDDSILSAEDPDIQDSPTVDKYLNTDAWKKDLAQNISNMPTDDQTWTTQTIPRLLGSLTDPLTLGAFKVAELGLKAALPEAATWLEAGTSDSLGTKLIKGAVEGGSVGLTAGTGIEGIDATVSPDKTSLPQYMANVASWGVLGMAGGLIAPLAKAGLNKLFSEPSIDPTTNNDPTYTQTTLNPESNSFMSKDTLDSQENLAIQQTNVGKRISTEPMSDAAQNVAINDFNNKTELYNQLDDATKAQTKSPEEQLVDEINSAQDAVDGSETSIKDNLDQIKDKYGNDVSNMALQTPLPQLFNAITKIDAIKDSINDPDIVSRLSSLSDQMKNGTHDVGYAKTVQNIQNNPLLIAKEENLNLINNLSKPDSEIKYIDDLDKSNYSDNTISRLEMRQNALKQVVETGNNSILDVSDLNNAIDDLANNQLDLRNSIANYDYHTSPLNNVSSSSTQMLNDMVNDKNYINHDDMEPSIDDEMRKDESFSPIPKNIQDMDNIIQQAIDNGIIDKNDPVLYEIKAIDAQELEDDKQDSIFETIKNCLLGN
jgi:hypothetical protein